MGTLLTGEQGTPALCPPKRAFFFNFFHFFSEGNLFDWKKNVSLSVPFSLVVHALSEFWSITVRHRTHHRWARWWTRRGTGSLRLHYFYSYLQLLLRLLRVETRSMDLENLYLTPCFSHDDHLTAVEYIKAQNTESVCTTREKETDRDTFFFKKNCPAEK